MKQKIGVIGGSGVYQLEDMVILDKYKVETPFGTPSDLITEAALGETKFFFLPRHGHGHSFLPHEVNYLANIYALKKLGVKILISASAVGSLSEELVPGTLFFPDQFIDWTKGKRERTFFGKGIVAHISTANPVDLDLQHLLYEQANTQKITCHKGGAYICIEGPQFSSKAESHIYRNFGAKVIGMTNVPEAYLAKEAGMSYATIAMITDYDCWKEEHCQVDEIMKVMKKNNLSVQKILKSAIPYISESNFIVKTENEVGVMTPKDKLSTEQIEILEVLLA